MKVEIGTINVSTRLDFDQAIHQVNKESEPLAYIISGNIQTAFTMAVNIAVIK